MATRPITFLLATLTAIIFIACGLGAESQGDATRTPASASSPTSTGSSATADPSATPATPTAPSATPTPSLKHPDMVIELKRGDFWDFRWEWTDQSCSQGRGCSGSDDTGIFTVTLGESRTIGGVEMFAVSVTGKHLADDGAVDFAPAWKYIGADGPLLLASNGSSNVTVFDALDGQWTGGGFFSRFKNNETHAARVSTVGSSQPFAQWAGFRTGPAITVVRSDSQSMCEIIEGRRICPNDSSFSLSETQYYRNEVGPLGYSYRFSASFSGGGFFSSSSSQESVALVGSSLRGDAPRAVPTPTPLPTQTPEPTLVPNLDRVFGPVDGALILTSDDNQIPDFETGVHLAEGVIDVTFANPDVGGGDWSYGVTFRHSGEETFHAVYVSSRGLWEHFARGGSVDGQVTPGRGAVSLNAGVGDENRLTVLFGLTEGTLWVNGEPVAELDLSVSAARVAGDVRVMAGILNTDVYNGAESEFYDLTVFAP